MKGLRRAVLLVSVFLLCGWARKDALAEEQHISTAVVPYSPPYQYVDGERVTGANIEIWNRIAGELGLSVDYRSYDTYEEAVAAVLQGEADTLLGACVDLEEVPELICSTSISTDSVCMLADKKILEDGDRTVTYSAAVEDCIAVSDEFITLPNTTYWISATTETALEQFQSYQLDYWVAPRATLVYYNRSGQDLEQYTISDNYISTIHYGLALPGNHTFLNSINNEIMRLKTTGELDDILDQWIPKESVPSELFSRYVFLLGCLCAVAVLILAIVIQINRYLKAQIDAKTKSLQILNHDLEEQIANVRQSNELKTLLIENNVEGVVIVTRENRISLFNEAAQRITGLKESPVGRILFDIPLFRKMLNPTEEGFPETAQKTNKLVRIMDSSDRIRFFRYNLFPLFAEEQEVQGLTLIFNDVTEQIRLENVAFEREKSRSIDRVVAGIAHEIRNPLTAIKTFAELLPAKNTDQEFQQEFSAIVPAEIQRFNQLITDLLEYAQPVRMTAQPVEAAELVYSTASLMQYNFAQKNVKIAASAEKGVYILANKQQLKQILINFLLNGFEAILEKQQPDNRTISITMSARDETVTFLVEDHGIGMTEQQIKNAREPFYSTKRNGTGLGLYIAQRYAQRNGGELYIESRKDMYTKIYLQFKQYYLQ